MYWLRSYLPSVQLVPKYVRPPICGITIWPSLMATAPVCTPGVFAPALINETWPKPFATKLPGHLGVGTDVGVVVVGGKVVVCGKVVAMVVILMVVGGKVVS